MIEGSNTCEFALPSFRSNTIASKETVRSLVCAEEQILQPEEYNQEPPVVDKTEREDQRTKRHPQFLPNTGVSMLTKDPAVPM
mmetsp:Transcript_7967/g.49211  ORF Transcript_7967/g.49211 Transcript_7967/m.49211 type:complete len:83 (-) Transcript_7967:954-1202(-)